MNKILTPLILLVSTVGISGCGTLDGLSGQFENVPACAIGEQKAFVLSMYGPLGVGSKLTDASAKVLCPIPAVAGNK